MKIGVEQSGREDGYVELHSEAREEGKKNGEKLKVKLRLFEYFPYCHRTIRGGS